MALIAFVASFVGGFDPSENKGSDNNNDNRQNLTAELRGCEYDPKRKVLILSVSLQSRGDEPLHVVATDFTYGSFERFKSELHLCMSVDGKKLTFDLTRKRTQGLNRPGEVRFVDVPQSVVLFDTIEVVGNDGPRLFRLAFILPLYVSPIPASGGEVKGQTEFELPDGPLDVRARFGYGTEPPMAFYNRLKGKHVYEIDGRLTTEWQNAVTTDFVTMTIHRE